MKKIADILTFELEAAFEKAGYETICKGYIVKQTGFV